MLTQKPMSDVIIGRRSERSQARPAIGQAPRSLAREAPTWMDIGRIRETTSSLLSPAFIWGTTARAG